MKVKGITYEDFVNYKKPSMFIAFPNCTFKCDVLNGCQICQNWALSQQEDIEIPKEKIIEQYINNPITKAIVMGGLEPFDSPTDVVSFVDCLRNKYNNNDDVVIYTGYTEEEMLTGNFDSEASTKLKYTYDFLCSFPNIIIKFGRFIMCDTPHYDELLGVELASHNQYAKIVSNTNNEMEEKGE